MRDGQRGSLALFFVLTFAVAWTLWWLASVITPATLTGGVRALFFLPGTFAPALVALFLNARARHAGQGPELVERLFLWQVPVRWYVFAAGFMIAAKLTAALAHRVLTSDWPTFGAVPLYLLLLGALVSTPVQAGEEIGWRGYALPRLAATVGFPAASLLLGAIWAVWHLPLFLIAGTDSTGQPFVVFVLAVIAASVAITWLYLHTRGSLLLVMLMHAAINNTTGVVPSARAEPLSPFDLSASLMAWLTTAVLWIAAGYFLIRMARMRSSDIQNTDRA